MNMLRQIIWLDSWRLNDPVEDIQSVSQASGVGTQLVAKLPTCLLRLLLLLLLLLGARMICSAVLGVTADILCG